MDELTTTRRWIERFRATVERKTAGLEPEQLAERAVPPSTLSPLGLVRHLAQLEHHWFVRVLQRSDEAQLFCDPTWDTQFDGAVGTPECVEEAFTAWRTACERADAFLDQLPDEALDVEIGDGDIATIRDVFLQVLQEYARHSGHLDLLRERIDGQTGE